MIRICREPRRLTLRGHAGCGPRGRDIVCAGVSSLVCALAEYLTRRGEAAELVMEPGHVAVAVREHSPALEVVCTGLRQLAAAYPQCVSFCEQNFEKGERA